MGEAIKPTFFEVQKRPLGVIPKTQLSPSAIPGIPRGSVRERIHFFEKLREEVNTSPQPPRRQTADAIFSGKKLNEVVRIAEEPEEVKIIEPPTREAASENLTIKAKEVEPEMIKPLPRFSLDSPTAEPPARSIPMAIFPPPTEPQLPVYEFTLSKASLSDAELKSRSSLSVSTTDPNRSEAINRDKDIDAICVNCLEYVTLTDVDDHSLMCYNPAYGNMDTKDEISLKIKKLHRAINRRIKTAKEAKLMTLMRLREITVEVTKNDNVNFARLELELDDIAVSSLAIDGALCCSVLARRLGNLLSEREMDTQSPETMLDYYNVEAEHQRQKLLRWRSHTNAAEEVQSPKRQLDEVKSDLGSDLGSAASSVSRNSEPVDESDIADLKSAEEGLKQMSEEQLKKYFYSMCLKHKLLMPKTHPGQKVMVSALFKEARKVDLPVSMWDKFITERLEG